MFSSNKKIFKQYYSVQLILCSARSPTSFFRRANKQSQKRCVSVGLHFIPRRTDIGIQDTPYLSPIIREIEAEEKERADLEALTIKRRA